MDAREDRRLRRRRSRAAASARAAGRRGRCAAFPWSMSRSCWSSMAARAVRRRWQRARLLSIRIVRGVEHLLRRDLAVEVEEVDRAPRGGVEEDAGARAEDAAPARPCRRHPQGDDQLRSSGCRSTSLARPAEIGGSPRPPWMRIGTRRSAASANTGSRRSSVSRKPCARGWSLMPLAPRSRSARLLHRRLGEVEAHEGDEPPAALLRPGARAVVGRGEGRVPVGLVHAERERLRDAVVVHDLRSSSGCRACRRCHRRCACAHRRRLRPMAGRHGASRARAPSTPTLDRRCHVS